MFKEEEPEFKDLEEVDKSRKDKGEKPKDTVFYRKFNKDAHVKALNVGEEEEKAATLARLDKQLDAESDNKPEKQEELKQRFKEISPMLNPGKLWIKAEVSGEVHNISFSSLEVKGKQETVDEVSGKLEKEEININEVLVNFALKNTEGRQESLNLNFKTSLAAMLEGGGKIEDKLQTLVTGQFAGTDNHYKRLAEEKEKTENVSGAPEQMENFKKGKRAIMDALEKKGMEVSEMEGGGLYSIITKIPELEYQLHISNINGRETWNVAAGERDQKNAKEDANLKPQEIISKYIEKPNE